MTPKKRLVGLAIMLMGIIVALGAGSLTFSGSVSNESGRTIIGWCIFVAFIGFILHMIAVVQQWKEKQAARENRK